MSDRKRSRPDEPATHYDPRKKFLDIKSSGGPGPSSLPPSASATPGTTTPNPAAAEHPPPLPTDDIPTKTLKHSNRCLADRVQQLNEAVREKSNALTIAKDGWAAQQKVLAVLAEQWDQMDRDVTSLIPSGSSLTESTKTTLYDTLAKGINSDQVAQADAVIKRRTERTSSIMQELVNLVKRAKEQQVESGADLNFSEQHFTELVTVKAELATAAENLDRREERIAELEHQNQDLQNKNASLKRRFEELKATRIAAASTAASIASTVRTNSGTDHSNTSMDEVRRELQFAQNQVSELSRQLAESKKNEAQLRMDNVSMEADKVKDSIEYKHLQQMMDAEVKQRTDERASARAQIDDLWQRLNSERAEADALRGIEEDRQAQFAKIIDDLKDEITKLTDQRDRLQLDLDVKSESSKNDLHSEELQKVIDQLKNEQNTNRTEIKRLRKVMRDRLLKSALEWEGDSQVIINTLKEETSRALKSEKDLKLLLNVHQNVSKDRREKVAISFSMQKAKDELSELKQKIATGEVGVESELRTSLQKASQKVDTMEAALKESAATEQALIEELESTGSTLDEVQEQNARLLKQLKEKESTTFELMAAKLSADQRSTQAERSRVAGEAAVKSCEDLLVKKDEQIASFKDNDKALRDMLRNLDKRLHEAEAQVEKGRQELDSKATSFNTSALQLQDLHAQLEKAKADYIHSVEANAKVEEEVRKLNRELNKTKSDCQRLQKSATMAGSGGGGDSGMRKLVLDLNKRLKCTLCKNNEKNAVISTCMHVFCHTCLDNQIRDRNRKCPICKNMFGANDIKRIWLDFGGEEGDA